MHTNNYNLTRPGEISHSFDIVYDNLLETFIEKVNEKMRAGYEFHGEIFILEDESGCVFFNQAMYRKRTYQKLND